MCHDMTGPAITAGRLGDRAFCLPFFLFFSLAGELFITHTCNERNHKRQMEPLKPGCLVPSSADGGWTIPL